MEEVPDDVLGAGFEIVEHFAGCETPTIRSPGVEAELRQMMINHTEARALVFTALTARGFSPRETEACVVEVLDAEWRGRPSHGLAIVPDLVEWSADKRHDPVVTTGAGCTAFVQGGDSPGPLVADVAMSAALGLAEQFGVGCVGVENRSPLLVAGHQPRRAARAGFVGVVMCTAPAKVAPAGGTTPLFGTNPIAAAFPRPGGAPIVIDLAMTSMPASEVRRRARLGEPLPHGVAVDAAGQPTIDPAAALSGAMLPFGGHKGSVLALMVELLAGALTGTRVGTSQPGERGMLFLTFAPDVFGREDAFLARTESIVADLLDAGPQVRVPGITEPDFDAPVDVPDLVVAAVRALAASPAT
jgi:(2R)-3-sulfolactate dehydrogenase (NADP+)